MADTTAFWDRDGSTSGAGGSTPTGTWDAASTWNVASSGTGGAINWLAGQSAVFAAGSNATGSYTVTVAGTQDISGLNFQEGTVTLTGGTALRLMANSTVDVSPGLTATVATPISQDSTSRSLTKSGTGTLALSGANTYTGRTSISQGKLIAQTSNAALGASAGVADVAAPATLQINQNNASPNTTFTVGNAIIGAGILEFTASAAPATSARRLITVGSLSAFTGTISILANGNYLADTTNDTANQNLTIATGGFLTISTSLNAGFGKLDGNGTIIRNIGGATTSTLTFGNNDATGGVFSGTIRGASTAADSLLFNSSGLIAVTKVGSGTQTLSGTNTYGGVTTISGGTLALGANNVLSNTTLVSIGNATLDAATFTDSVGTLDATGNAVLHLGTGAALAFATGSPAWTGTLALTGTFVSGASLRFGTSSGGLTPAQIARISAPGWASFLLNDTGFLTATAAGAGYASWASTHAPTGTAADDYDGDGVSNGAEHVLGGTKDTKACLKLPKVAISGGNMLFTFERDQASIHAATRVVIDTGINLADWPAPGSYAVPDGAATAAPGVSVLKNTPTTGKDTVILSVPRDPDQKKFVRLRVSAER